jgi:Domain of unknown function (DUF4406)
MNERNIQLVYVAGPFTGATRDAVEANIAAAVETGLEVARIGACPVIPHSNTAHPTFEDLQDYEWWIDATAKMLTKCDALITTPNWEHSRGARGEVLLARERGIPVFHSLSDLKAWLSVVVGIAKRETKLRTGWTDNGRVLIEVNGQLAQLTPKEARPVLARLRDALAQAVKRLPN